MNPTAIGYGPVTVVTGTATCPTADLGTATTDAEGVTHYRAGTFRCLMRTDDPRVSGTHTSTTWNADLWGEADLNQAALVQWATVRLENDGGAWEGRLSGVASFPERGDIIAIWYTGTGGYAGLSYFELWTGQEPWTIQGQIFPGSPPSPAGTPPVAVATPTPPATTPPATPPGVASPTPSAIAYGPVSVVAGFARCPKQDLGPITMDATGVQHSRGGTFECIWTINDPRVSGTSTSAWNMDFWGTQSSGALVQWETMRLENAGGAWEGRGSGVYSTARGDLIAFWYAGTGRYHGLTYFALVTGAEPWTIYGQIFPGSPPTP